MKKLLNKSSQQIFNEKYKAKLRRIIVDHYLNNDNNITFDEFCNKFQEYTGVQLYITIQNKNIIKPSLLEHLQIIYKIYIEHKDIILSEYNLCQKWYNEVINTSNIDYAFINNIKELCNKYFYNMF